MKNKQQNPLGILEESLGAVGSNPGNTKLNPLRWIKMNPKPVIIQFLGLVFGAYLMTNLHWIFTIIFIGFVLWTALYWWNTKSMFKVGDVNPGKVISINPDRIAVATDMTKGFGEFPILKIAKTNLLAEDKVLNKIIPTIAGYTNNPYDYPFWSEFNVVPINHGVTNKAKLREFSNSYSAVEINRIDEYLEQLDSLEPETYKIDETTTDWVDYQQVIVGDLSKMKGPDGK